MPDPNPKPKPDAITNKPKSAPTSAPRAKKPNPETDVSKGSLSGKQAYNLVTDTVAGPNVRFKDNLIQGIAIAISLVIGLAIGFFVAPPADRLMGVLIGGIAGLMVGLFGSGIFLMIYRMVKHARGEHD